MKKRRYSGYVSPVFMLLFVLASMLVGPTSEWQRWAWGTNAVIWVFIAHLSKLLGETRGEIGARLGVSAMCVLAAIMPAGGIIEMMW